MNISSYAGTTPAQAANGRGRSEMVGLLIKYGAADSASSGTASTVAADNAISRRERSRERAARGRAAGRGNSHSVSDPHGGYMHW